MEKIYARWNVVRLRAIRNGSKFIKLDGVYGMYYMNPDGLSTNHETQKERWLEERKVFNEYKDIFPESAKALEGYFNR